MPSNTDKQAPGPWHALAAEAALDLARASSGGLTKAEAGARLQAHGPNRLPEPPQRSAWLRFLFHFHNILIYVLLASAVVTAALGHVIDTLIILAVVLASVLFWDGVLIVGIGAALFALLESEKQMRLALTR